MRRSRESLHILPIIDHTASVRDQERARLQQIAAERGADLVTARDSQNPVRDMYARANVPPRRLDGQRRLRHAIDLHVPERQVLRARKEAAHNGITDTLHLAPPHKRRGPLEHDHPRVKRQPLIARDMQRRTRAIVQPHADPFEP